MTPARLVHVAPLGLRLWDDGACALITDDLDVRASDPAGSAREHVAAPSPSGCFVFHALPGLGPFERGELGPQPAPRRFNITVTHRRGAFLPVYFQCDAPQRGFARPLVALRPARPLTPLAPTAPDPSVPLFPAAARPTRSGVATLRAELRLAGDTPAACALLEATSAGRLVARGLADARGRVLLVFPFPPLDPLARPAPRAPTVTWSLTLSAYHDAAALAAHADLDAVMAAPRRRLRPLASGDFTDTLTRELRPDRPLELGALELQP